MTEHKLLSRLAMRELADGEQISDKTIDEFGELIANQIRVAFKSLQDKGTRRVTLEQLVFAFSPILIGAAKNEKSQSTEQKDSETSV